MGLFGKSKKQKELDVRRNLYTVLSMAENANKNKNQKERQILYQCRYCGLKYVRNAKDGAPSTIATCPRHPKGRCQGTHSWMRTYL